MTYYGGYLVSLVESPSLYRLSDENVLNINIVPKPTLVKTTVASFATSVSVADPFQERTSA